MSQGLLVFELDEREFAVDLALVREIDRLVPVTPLPRVAAYVEGVVNLRGALVPVVNLRARLEMSRETPTKASRIIVLEMGSRRVGMIVDAVTEVLRVEPELIDAVEGTYTRGVAKVDDRRVGLLDLDKVLSHGGASEGLEADVPKDSV